MLADAQPCQTRGKSGTGMITIKSCATGDPTNTTTSSDQENILDAEPQPYRRPSDFPRSRRQFVEARADLLKAAGVKAALLGMPYDMGGIWRSGTADGPRGLRDASRQYGSYFFDDNVDLFEAFKLTD